MVNLLDARGYEIVLHSSSALPIKILYFGAVEARHRELRYDEDPYVVSRVENEVFCRDFSIVLKDEGIRKSGLSLWVEAEEGTEIAVTVCGEPMGSFTVGAEGRAEKRMEVKELCRREREYLENIHRMLYLLLAEVDRVCAKHGLQYFLVFGGLLGVLRYGDIIPWDDDIDIAMTRADYERFKAIAPKEFGADFALLDCSAIGKDAFLDFLCRVLYKKEKVPVNVFQKVSGRCRKEIENHLALDIYLLDNASDHAYFHKLHMLLVRGVYGLGMGHRTYLHQEEYARRDRMTRLSVCLLPALGRWIPLPWIFWLHNRVSTLVKNKETKDYFMSNGFLPFIHTRYSKAWFGADRRVKLGDMEVSAPVEMEAYLKRAYYDYYHYPPVNKRVPGHSPDADGVF